MKYDDLSTPYCLSIDTFSLLGDGIPGIAVFNQFPSTPSHLFSQPSVTQQPDNGIRQCHAVTNPDKVTMNPVL